METNNMRPIEEKMEEIIKKVNNNQRLTEDDIKKLKGYISDLDGVVKNSEKNKKEERIKELEAKKNTLKDKISSVLAEYKDTFAELKKTNDELNKLKGCYENEYETLNDDEFNRWLDKYDFIYSPKNRIEDMFYNIADYFR